MIRYFNRAGEPIEDTHTWARMYENDEYRRVALDRVGDIRVSTIWQGFDTNDPLMQRTARPEIFETQVALWPEGADDPEWVEYERWSSEASALAAHNDIVQMLKFIGNDELPKDWRPSWQS